MTDLSTVSTHELCDELAKRDGVWSRNIIPCEHYKIVLQGDMIVEQSIGLDNTRILVVTD